MPESSPPSSKLVPILFAATCLAGIAALIYFAHSAALQSVPAYSTLNTNPDGAKLLFDGLQDADFVEVSRQFKNVSLEKPRHATVFFLGVSRDSLISAGDTYFDEMESAAKRGNNLVIAVPGEEEYSFTYDGPRKQSPLEKHWGIRFISDKNVVSEPTVDNAWRSIGAGIWQRTFGQGSITFLMNGQRLSNRGVATKEENRQLLNQLVAGYPAVIFEEAHLGIVETGSIAGLARRYHLQGLLAGLMLVAVLFIWSRSVSFPPIPPAAERTFLGADTRSMLTELMSRHLKGQLIDTCVAEWNRTRPQSLALRPPAESNAVAAYVKLQESLQKRSKFTL